MSKYYFNFNFNHLLFQGTQYTFKEYKCIVSQHTHAGQFNIFSINSQILHVTCLGFVTVFHIFMFIVCGCNKNSLNEQLFTLDFVRGKGQVKPFKVDFSINKPKSVG